MRPVAARLSLVEKVLVQDDFIFLGLLISYIHIVLIQVVPIHSLVMPKELNSDPFIMKLTAGLNLCDRALY